MKLCSACLLGINCKYNGKNNLNDKVVKLAKKEQLIPVCPEQLGGLNTPRNPSEQKNNKVISRSSKNTESDVTDNFQNGTKEALKIAKLFSIEKAIFKQRSPSCGSGWIYNGTFSKKLVKGNGITTALLKRNGIKVISEEDL